MKNNIRKIISQKIVFQILVLGVIGTIAGLSFLAQEIQADDASSSASVTNALPSAGSVSVDSGAGSVTLLENTTQTVTATFTVSDNNGCEDIDSHGANDTIAVFHRTNVASGSGCSADDDDCYAMSCSKANCTGGGADLIYDFTCTAAVQFHADPTDAGSANEATEWTATAIPRDNAGTDGTTATDTIEIATLTALNVTSSIAYGSLALNADTGSADQTTTVTNTGNEQIDIQLDGYGASDGDGYSMACTVGTIAIGQERYDTATSTAWSSKTQLTDTATTLSSFNLAKKTNGASTKDVYWGFGLPATGVGGSCSGTVQFTAVSG